MPDMYAIDYNIETSRFQALFCHGTSSESVNSILQNGIVRPNYDAVIDQFLTQNAQANNIINNNRDIIANGPLGLTERIREDDVVFATWFANQVGLQMLRDEIGPIARHGGEIYSRTWTAISALLRANDIAAPAFKHPTATAAVIFFQVPFDLLMQEIPYPRSKYEFIEELSWNLYDGTVEPYRCIMEVKFLDNLPVNHILWHGSFEDAASQLSQNLISPAAYQALLEKDPFMDLNPSLRKPRSRV